MARGPLAAVDPELGSNSAFDVHDIPAGPNGPFETASEAWLGWRTGSRDLSSYGVEGYPDTLSGPDFVRDYVIFEVAHRYGDEMLLWDGWGATEEPVDLRVIDEVAQLVLHADAGDDMAEADLWSRYREDELLHPGRQVMTYSPYGRPARRTDLLTESPSPDRRDT